MSLKTITHPVTGDRFKMGRNRPALGRKKLNVRNYLNPSTLPAAPASVHYSHKAEIALSQMYGNDQEGNCVPVGMAHLTGVFTGNSGATPAVFTMDQINAVYGAVGGFVAGNAATDNGCDEQTALQYWVDHGFTPDHKILGWASVDIDHAREVIWLFENLFQGKELPDKWVNPPPSTSGFVWDVAGVPVPENGHCTVSPGYNANGVDECTWGMVGLQTWAALEKYGVSSAGGELYTVVTSEILDRATKKAPSGFDLDQLIADFSAMGGTPKIVV